VKVEDEVEVKILKVDTDARKIGLSLRRVQWAAEEQEQATEQPPQPRTPSGPEKVLSDAALLQITKARQNKVHEQQDTEKQQSPENESGVTEEETSEHKATQQAESDEVLDEKSVKSEDTEDFKEQNPEN
ncbi:hypothetical protein ACFLZ8_00120, partial [Planctomycetota bacterium]